MKINFITWHSDAFAPKMILFLRSKIYSAHLCINKLVRARYSSLGAQADLQKNVLKL